MELKIIQMFIFRIFLKKLYYMILILENTKLLILVVYNSIDLE